MFHNKISLEEMTDFHSDTDTDFSDGETIYSDSDISSDESMHTSDEDFINDSDVSEDETESSEDESDDEYIPHKRQKIDSSKLTIVNVSVSSS